ncbi:MAG: ABC transporter permease [Acidobacteria bacterium]|nr:ABC transporter permease [Acidobacteriota bacterium]
MSATLAEKKNLETVNEQTVAPVTEPVLENVIEWNDSLWSHLKELVKHSELLLLITQRELKVRYKQSVLGVLWAVLQPFSMMLVFSLFFGRFQKMPSDGIPYPLFSYSALLPWTFFATALAFAIPSLIQNSQLITKIYFPREIIPLASVFAAFVDFLIASSIFVGMMFWYQVTPTWNLLYVFPLVALQVLFTIGVCLLLSSFTVLYRDVRHTLPLVIQIWLFATPVLYPVSVIPEQYRTFYMLINPMAGIIDGYRRAVVLGIAPELKYLGLATLVSLFLVWAGYKYFKHLEHEFADIV